ncbi:hypothetical protein CDIK_1828 [Cucumispora dikerogammari]|nr:hypothetical protein CDIK_1828 [Cucumispora dikerogammari]
MNRKFSFNNIFKSAFYVFISLLLFLRNPFCEIKQIHNSRLLKLKYSSKPNEFLCLKKGIGETFELRLKKLSNITNYSKINNADYIKTNKENNKNNEQSWIHIEKRMLFYKIENRRLDIVLRKNGETAEGGELNTKIDTDTLKKDRRVMFLNRESNTVNKSHIYKKTPSRGAGSTSYSGDYSVNGAAVLPFTTDYSLGRGYISNKREVGRFRRDMPIRGEGSGDNYPLIGAENEQLEDNGPTYKTSYNSRNYNSQNNNFKNTNYEDNIINRDHGSMISSKDKHIENSKKLIDEIKNTEQLESTGKEPKTINEIKSSQFSFDSPLTEDHIQNKHFNILSNKKPFDEGIKNVSTQDEDYKLKFNPPSDFLSPDLDSDSETSADFIVRGVYINPVSMNVFRLSSGRNIETYKKNRKTTQSSTMANVDIRFHVCLTYINGVFVFSPCGSSRNQMFEVVTIDDENKMLKDRVSDSQSESESGNIDIANRKNDEEMSNSESESQKNTPTYYSSKRAVIKVPKKNLKTSKKSNVKEVNHDASEDNKNYKTKKHKTFKNKKTSAGKTKSLVLNEISSTSSTSSYKEFDLNTQSTEDTIKTSKNIPKPNTTKYNKQNKYSKEHKTNTRNAWLDSTLKSPTGFREFSQSPNFVETQNATYKNINNYNEKPDHFGSSLDYSTVDERNKIINSQKNIQSQKVIKTQKTPLKVTRFNSTIDNSSSITPGISSSINSLMSSSINSSDENLLENKAQNIIKNNKENNNPNIIRSNKENNKPDNKVTNPFEEMLAKLNSSFSEPKLNEFAF